MFVAGVLTRQKIKYILIDHIWLNWLTKDNGDFPQEVGWEAGNC